MRVSSKTTVRREGDRAVVAAGQAGPGPVRLVEGAERASLREGCLCRRS